MTLCIEDRIYGATPSDQALFSILCDSFKLGLRDQEQVAGALQAILLNWPKDEHIHLAYLLFLIIAKHISTSLFQQLAENRIVDSSKFAEILSTKLLGGATFKTRDLISHDRPSSGVAEHKVLDLLWAYQSLQNQTCHDLWRKDYNTIKFPDKIVDAVRQGCPNSFPSGEKPVPPISCYARRVSQAGQLIVK